MRRVRWWFLLALLALAAQPGIATVSGITSGPGLAPVSDDSIMLPGGMPTNEPVADCS